MRDLARPIVVLPLALLLMALLIGAAFCADCVRMAARIETHCEQADEPLQRAEGRVVEILRQQSRLPREVENGLNRYDPAAAREVRHLAFEQLAGHLPLLYNDTSAEATTRLRDDLEGALNRRRLALEEYRRQAQQRSDFRGSLRGRVARRFGGG